MDYRTLAEQLLRALAFQSMPLEESKQLSIGERGILNYLCFYRDDALSGEISRDLGITTGRTAIALKGLEKKGMICRSASETDRRCVNVRITQAGREAAESFRTQVLESIERMLRELGADDAREYVRIVSRINELHLAHCRAAEEKLSPE